MKRELGQQDISEYSKKNVTREGSKRVTEILPARSFSFWDLRELWEYRELVAMFVKRDFHTMYAQTVLGPAWFILTSLMSSSVLTLVFGGIANISTDGVPQFLFYMAGNILWADFSGCITSVSDTFVGNARLMGKVYFPRLTVPLASVISKQIRFLIQLAIFLVCYAIFWFRSPGSLSIGWEVLLTPLILLYLMALSLGVGMILASLTTKYKDLIVLSGFGLQIWMYISPVVYPITQIPEKWRFLMMFNPAAPALEAFREIWFGAGSLTVGGMVIGICMTALVLAAGTVLFQKAQRNFMDTI